MSGPQNDSAQRRGRQRAQLIVEVDLDPVPGWGNNARDFQQAIQRHLNSSVPHYNPDVRIVAAELLADVQAEYAKAAESWDRSRERLTADLGAVRLQVEAAEAQRDESNRQRDEALAVSPRAVLRAAAKRLEREAALITGLPGDKVRRSVMVEVARSLCSREFLAAVVVPEGQETE